MTSPQHDFTRGGVWRHLVVFSGPLMLASLLQVSYQFVDSLWVGNLLGAEALGAVAVSTTIVFTVLSFVIGMTNAALPVLSQLKGRGDHGGLRRSLNAFVVVLFALSLVLGIAGFALAEPLLRLMGTPLAILESAREYLQITFLGMLFLFGYNFISTVLRALGDSRTPMRFVIVAVLLNVVLDPVFIEVFGWDVRGAAIATVVSQGVAFVYGLTHVALRKLAPLQVPRLPAWRETRLILRLGIPAGLQMAVISGGAAAIMSVVNSFGGDVVGGFGAAQRLDALIMVPAQALGIAASSMAGQNIGVGDWGRVRQISRATVLANLACMVAIAIVLVIFAEPAVRMFLPDDEPAVAFAAQYLRVIALCYPFLGINFVLNGIVRAAGAMIAVLVLNIVSFWVLRFPLTWLAAHLFGEIGIPIGMGASLVISSLCAFLYYRFGRWRERPLFGEDDGSGDGDRAT
ncbi:MAG: MATE family efflux transporter [Pseudoclavibacter sp.]